MEQQLGPQHLERHLAIVLEILGEVDGGHPTRTELALDRVAIGEGDGETVALIRQQTLLTSYRLPHRESGGDLGHPARYRMHYCLASLQVGPARQDSFRRPMPAPQL